MKKIGITGQNGFVGWHLYHWLNTKKEEYTLVNFNREYFEDTSLLIEFVKECDVIVHLSALNRHQNQEIIYNTNVTLVEKLIAACKNAKKYPLILFSSSTQETQDNLYGKSKLKGKELFKTFANEHNSSFVSLQIPNVFGPFGLPDYNSFVATFCQKLVNNHQPEIKVDSEVGLIYVQELVERITGNLNYSGIKEEIIEPGYHIKVSEVLSLLSQYKVQYLEAGQIPVLNNKLEINLFNTFRSFINPEINPRPLIPHADNRGRFVEIIRSDIGGQTSYSTTFPEITRGNHFHTRKIERFAVIKGKALIQLRKVGSEKVFNFFLNGESPSYVDMPVWFTHNIKNIGNEELLTVFWINEAFDPNDPDTYFETV